MAVGEFLGSKLQEFSGTGLFKGLVNLGIVIFRHKKPSAVAGLAILQRGIQFDAED